MSQSTWHPAQCAGAVSQYTKYQYPIHKYFLLLGIENSGSCHTITFSPRLPPYSNLPTYLEFSFGVTFQTEQNNRRRTGRRSCRNTAQRRFLFWTAACVAAAGSERRNKGRKILDESCTQPHIHRGQERRRPTNMHTQAGVISQTV